MFSLCCSPAFLLIRLKTTLGSSSFFFFLLLDLVVLRHQCVPLFSVFVRSWLALSVRLPCRYQVFVCLLASFFFFLLPGNRMRLTVNRRRHIGNQRKKRGSMQPSANAVCWHEIRQVEFVDGSEEKRERKKKKKRREKHVSAAVLLLFISNSLICWFIALFFSPLLITITAT